MMADLHDVKTNIKVGQQIFENLPKDIGPGWAGLVLSVFDHYVKDIPAPILELYLIIYNKDQWKEAQNKRGGRFCKSSWDGTRTARFPSVSAQGRTVLRTEDF